MKRIFVLLFIMTIAFSFSGCAMFSGKKAQTAAKIEKPQEIIVLNSLPDSAEMATDIAGIRALNGFQPRDANSAAPAAAIQSEKSGNVTAEISEASPSKISLAKSKNRKPASNSRPSDSDEMYTVKNGDTLMKISYEKLGNIYRWREIFNQNRDKIPNYNQLVTGSVLTIRGVEYVVLVREGKPYLIKKSDSLTKISKALYGTTAGWRSLWLHNSQLIHDPNKIYAGFTMYYLNDYKSISQSLTKNLISDKKLSGSRLPAKKKITEGNRTLFLLTTSSYDNLWPSR